MPELVLNCALQVCILAVKLMICALLLGPGYTTVGKEDLVEKTINYKDNACMILAILY